MYTQPLESKMSIVADNKLSSYQPISKALFSCASFPNKPSFSGIVEASLPSRIAIAVFCAQL
jgi:hypothetical protein